MALNKSTGIKACTCLIAEATWNREDSGSPNSSTRTLKQSELSGKSWSEW